MKRSLTPYSPNAAPLAKDRPQPVFSGASAGESSDVDIVRWWRVLQRRRGLMAIVFIAVVGIVGTWTLLKPKAYTTEVRLIAGSAPAAQTGPLSPIQAMARILPPGLPVPLSQVMEPAAERSRRTSPAEPG